jgi:LAO/AO transport system kinase
MVLGIISMRGESLDLKLVSDAINGDRRSIARVLSSLENRSVSLNQIKAQFPLIFTELDTSSWSSIAITGAPGVGKSCLIDKILINWSSKGIKTALLAIDPSSPRTGGALLGDRVRITAIDDEQYKDLIYIRSIATRKSSGSAPLIVSDMVEFLSAIGWQRVIIETVGSGQSEVRCAAITDRIVVVEGPARGDGVQAEKAGLLELADAVIVNKSDISGASQHASEIKESFELGLGQTPPIILTSAISGEGIEVASSVLLELEDTGRSKRAKWRERLLAEYERKILESDKLEDILENLAIGSMSIEDALKILGDD